MMDLSDKNNFIKLSGIMDELSQNGKMAIFMHYHEGLSYEEIAVVLDMTPEDIMDIITLSQDYIIEETEDADVLSAIPEFFSMDIASKINPRSEDVPADHGANNNRINKRRNPRKIGYKKIILIAAVITLLSSVVAFAMVGISKYNSDPGNNDSKTDSVVNNQKDSDVTKEDDKDGENENSSGSAVDQTKTTGSQSNDNGTVQGKSGKIIFSGSDCKCGHVNPTSVNISGLAGDESNFQWEIKDSRSGKVIASGKGKNAGKEIKSLYDKGKDGNYLLTFKYEDSEGNIVWIKRAFIIDTGEIDKNQYS